jgi:hypothetical protein
MRSGGLHVAEGVARACGIAQMRAHESPSAACPLGNAMKEGLLGGKLRLS